MGAWFGRYTVASIILSSYNCFSSFLSICPPQSILIGPSSHLRLLIGPPFLLLPRHLSTIVHPHWSVVPLRLLIGPPSSHLHSFVELYIEMYSPPTGPQLWPAGSQSPVGHLLSQSYARQFSLQLQGAGVRGV